MLQLQFASGAHAFVAVAVAVPGALRDVAGGPGCERGLPRDAPLMNGGQEAVPVREERNGGGWSEGRARTSWVDWQIRCNWA